MENRNEENRSNENRKHLTPDGICFGIAALFAIAGIGVAIDSHRQLKKTLRIVGKAADSVAELTAVDVQQSIIDRAVVQAADRETNRVVGRAVKLMEDEMTQKAQKMVRNAVQESRGKLQKAVTDAIAKEAANVDSSEIMAEATEKAKELLLERFDGKLDGLMSDYQRNLDNVGRIYQSIASSMADKAGKDVTLKVG